MARSTDDGTTFEPERIAFDSSIGACGCSGMKAYADAAGVCVLFRSADQVVNRDIWLLTSGNNGKTFKGTDVSRWKIGACVMSAASLTHAPQGLLAAWETEKQTYFGRVVNGAVVNPVAAAGTARDRKFPVLAVNVRGDVLFAWTEAWRGKRRA